MAVAIIRPCGQLKSPTFHPFLETPVGTRAPSVRQTFRLPEELETAAHVLLPVNGRADDAIKGTSQQSFLLIVLLNDNLTAVGIILMSPAVDITCKMRVLSCLGRNVVLAS